MNKFVKSFLNLFYSQYVPDIIEMIYKFKCHFPIKVSSTDTVLGANEFFKENHFTIGYNMYDVNWDEPIILEEIFKKLILVFNFDPNDSNIMVLYKNCERVYLPNRKYVYIPPGSIFVYDKTKLKVLH